MIDREFVDRLVDAAHVRYYASGIDGARVWWPWRMNKAKGHAGPASRRKHRDKSDHFLLDSNFKDEAVTNEVVLDEALELEADGAVLADVYQEMEPTVGALLEGLDLADSHGYDGIVVLPLQAPHDECYRRVAPSVDRDNVWWGVGGLKEKSSAVKLAAARDLREAAGPDPWIHGLGFGPTDVLGRGVRQDPDLLDSIDNATSTSNAVSTLSGTKEKTTITAAYATAERLEGLRKLTPFAEEKPPEKQRDDGQAGFDHFARTDGGDRQ